MNKTLKKTLSIILTILMIVTTVPFAFAADETPDFSDAKVLTSVDGMLYIDGVEAEITTNTFGDKNQHIPDGKYKLEGNITTDACFFRIDEEAHVILDLNGYTWDFMEGKYITSNGSISVYDTSDDETGKLVSTREVINLNKTGSAFNLYGGTVETTGTSSAVFSNWGSSNLYGGKIKSNGYAIYYNMKQNITINLDGTVLESGEDYAQIDGFLGVNSTTVNAVIDVTDYICESMIVDVEIIDTVGKLKIFEGISAEDAEKYTVNVTCSEDFDCFFEKEEYDEATGEKYIYIAGNAFTQQPTAENNYTVDFNNPDASFQWYEVEETALDGETGETLQHPECEKTYYCKATVGESVYLSDIVTAVHDIVVDKAVDPTCTETGLTEGSHCTRCEDMTVEQEVVPALNHKDTLVQVDAKAPTCTEIGWDAYEYCTACDYSTYKKIPAADHVDSDGDYLCDNDCGHEFEKPADNCDHLCHNDGFLGFFWKIACFFFRLFNLQQYCDCGELHYDAPILG